MRHSDTINVDSIMYAGGVIEDDRSDASENMPRFIEERSGELGAICTEHAEPGGEANIRFRCTGDAADRGSD